MKNKLIRKYDNIYSLFLYERSFEDEDIKSQNLNNETKSLLNAY